MERKLSAQFAVRPHFDVPPEPFLGLHCAPLVLLEANPGRSDDDHQAWDMPGVTERALNAARASGGADFRWLADDLRHTPGGRWWRRCLHGLTSQSCSFTDLSRLVLAVEFHGYHSRSWAPLPFTVPSQRFSFDLVRQAIDRKAVIVILRTARCWRVAVPELATYSRVVLTNTQRRSSVSAGNLSAKDFALVQAALQLPLARHKLRRDRQGTE